MKKKILFTLLLLSAFISYGQYNNDTAVDIILVKSECCYMYNTPQTISNEDAKDSLLIFPIGMPIKTCGYRNNYYQSIVVFYTL